MIFVKFYREVLYIEWFRYELSFFLFVGSIHGTVGPWVTSFSHSRVI